MATSKALLQRIPLLALVVAVVSIASCEDQPTEPGAAPRDALRPSLDVVPPPSRPDAPGTIRGTITPGFSNVAIGPIALGTFANPTYVKITTTSTVERWWSDGSWNDPYAGLNLHPVGPGSTWSSTYGCWNHPFYKSQRSTSAIAHCYAAGGMTMSKNAWMSGAVTAYWSPKTFSSVGNCDWNGKACYKYTGAYTVKIEPSFGALLLSA